jgi:hypothetical protein
MIDTMIRILVNDIPDLDPYAFDTAEQWAEYRFDVSHERMLRMLATFDRL